MRPLIRSLRIARAVIVSVVGFTLLVVGVALIFLPGPAFVVIPMGLALLATEFLWARRLLQHVRQRIENRLRSRAPGRAEAQPPDQDSTDA